MARTPSALPTSSPHDAFPHTKKKHPLPLPTQTDLASARADLAARERALAAREAAVRRAEAEVRRVGGAAGAAARGPEKNWPRCCPVAHHDIDGEVPAGAQAAVRAGYRAFLGLVACLTYNLVGVAAMFFAHKMDVKKFPALLMAAIYFFAGIPGAWVLWYMRLYGAAIKDRALSYAAFFIFFAAHLVFCAWSAVGPPFASGDSHTGIIVGVSHLSSNVFSGVVYLIGGVLWGLESLWSLWAARAVYAAFRGQGADRRLKQELAAAGAAAGVRAAGAAARV
jgi:secretory carrier-associated membrane protein